MATAAGASELGEQGSLSGLLFPAERRIWVNAEEARNWPGRRRFTIGHELGHFLMHCDHSEQTVFCRHAAVDPEQGADEAESGDEGASEIEAEANAFAAALLMPRELMRETYMRLRDEPERFKRMCQLFGSSQTAMGHRLHAVI